MSDPPDFTTRPELTGTFGMVAASHYLAAQAGMALLEQGGNAFDAATAAGFVLQVVEPHQNGPGGEAPMLCYSAADREAFVVDGQGPAPRAATAEHFTSLGLELVPGAGLLAACVPAALGSWLFVLERFGTMPLRQVLSAAIGYARDGFPALPMLSGVLAASEDSMRAHWPSSASVWLQQGVPAPGERMRNRALAATYERILVEAESAGGSREAQLAAANRAIYEGFVAEAIDSFCRVAQPDPAGRHAGLLTADDMANWAPSLEAPTRLAYRDLEVLKTPAWGQGPVMLQQLALLGGIDVRGLGAASADLVHTVTECAKLAFADREAYYGDPRAVEVPMEELLSPAYTDERRRLIGAEASDELRPGRPGGRLPRLPAWAGDPRGTRADRPAHGASAFPAPSEPGRRDTCHVDVADRFGNLVSATPSGGWLQSSPAIEELGFCLGTRAQMFWLEQGLASSLAPGRRPRTTLSPSLALRDGEPYLAFGTPGGDQQDQWPLLFLCYHVDFGLDLQAAVDTANWHTTHPPSSFYPRGSEQRGLHAETSLGREVLDELRRRGHAVAEEPPFSQGRVTAVSRSPGGLLKAAADARGAQAYAAGR